MSDPVTNAAPHPSVQRWLVWVTLVGMVAGGAASLWLGQDQNFDQLNYHYYVGYAFLHGRFDWDLVPCGIQTYHAPLMHVVHYLGMAHLPPRVFGFLLGAVHGLNLPALFLLAAVALPILQPRRNPIALLAALVGVGGPAVSMLGTTFGDNLVSIPALVALALVLGVVVERGSSPASGPSTACSTPTSAPRLLTAGILAGAATGLKLTMVVYNVALFAATLPLLRQKARCRTLAALALGSVLGFLPTGGGWAFKMTRDFGNPVFPFANGFFRSEYFAPVDFGSQIYVTRTLWDVGRPLVDTILGRHHRLQEVAVRDGRLLLLALLGLASLGVVVRCSLQGRRTRIDPAAVALLAYCAASYLLWVVLLPYYRYLTPLEMLAPVVIFAVLARILPARLFGPAVLALALGLALTTRTGSWGRRGWESETPLRLEVPPLGMQPHSVFLMVGQPSAYAIPSFREDARFLHLTAIDRFHAPGPWKARARDVLRNHRGPLLLMSNFEFSWAEARARAAEFGLRATDRCAPVRKGPLRFRLCELEREGSPAAALPGRL